MWRLRSLCPKTCPSWTSYYCYPCPSWNSSSPTEEQERLEWEDVGQRHSFYFWTSCSFWICRFCPSCSFWTLNYAGQPRPAVGMTTRHRRSQWCEEGEKEKCVGENRRGLERTGPWLNIKSPSTHHRAVVLVIFFMLTMLL